MPKSKNKSKRNNNPYNEEDFYEVKGKGIRKEKRKAKRHLDKSYLKDTMEGEIDWDDYADYYDI
ncbi:hypothetical protein CMI47_21955 [Candidatus Pacearchaeota archaeon]|jgi:hypothetical protein|nr:hypothetical protein [Candidatus Pacearchaeota archaeon]|tara:strand:- start:553 stop:744 length:192 start_codon:yes stop_codon:yes gene_type:complete